MTVTRVQVAPHPPDLNPPRSEHTFAELVAGREQEFPLLARALAASVPAKSCKIEWIGAGGVVQENYTSILRYPYQQSAEQGSASRGEDTRPPAESLTEFLRGVEVTLWDGMPTIESGKWYRTTCGGVRHFLGRDPQGDDSIILRPLREPFMWTWTHDFVDDETGAVVGYDSDRPAHWVEKEQPLYEWLAEFSLEVTPAP